MNIPHFLQFIVIYFECLFTIISIILVCTWCKGHRGFGAPGKKKKSNLKIPVSTFSWANGKVLHPANYAGGFWLSGSCICTDTWNSAAQDSMLWDKRCLLLCDRLRVKACSTYSAELPLDSWCLITSEEALSTDVQHALLCLVTI